MQPIPQWDGRVPPEDDPVGKEVPLLQGRESRAIYVHDVRRRPGPALARRDRVQRPPACVVDRRITRVVWSEREGRRGARGHLQLQADVWTGVGDSWWRLRLAASIRQCLK